MNVCGYVVSAAVCAMTIDTNNSLLSVKSFDI